MQNQAYKDCMRNAYGKSKWLLFLDIDEFLFCGNKWCPDALIASPCKTNWIENSLRTAYKFTMDLRVPWYFASTLVRHTTKIHV